MCDPVEQLVDLEVDSRTDDEIVGAYRALCAMVLYRTALAAGRPVPPRRQEIRQKTAARDWISGGRGILTFECACEALDLDPEAARRKLRDYANPANAEAINRRRRKPRNHVVFGRRQCNGTESDAGRENPAAGGVGAGPPNPPGDSRI